MEGEEGNWESGAIDSRPILVNTVISCVSKRNSFPLLMKSIATLAHLGARGALGFVRLLVFIAVSFLPMEAEADWGVVPLKSGLVANDEQTSIVLDSSGNPHIVFFDGTFDDLAYARWSGISWSTRSLDAPGWVGETNSIAVDVANDIHVCYFDATNQDLKYLRTTAGVWGVPEVVDGTGNVGSHCAIAVSLGGSVHISYFDETNLDLKYAKKTAGWAISTVPDPESWVGDQSSILADAGGNADLIYYGNGNLKHVRNAGGWGAISVLDPTIEKNCVPAGKTAAGLMRAAYINSSDKKVYGQFHDGASWNLQATISSASAGNSDSDLGPSLAVDSSGNAYYAYVADFGGLVISSRSASTGVNRHQVVASGSDFDPANGRDFVSGCNSIAIRDDGFPHLTFYTEHGVESLFYAAQLPSRPNLPTVSTRTATTLTWTWDDNSLNESGFIVVGSSGGYLSPYLGAGTTIWIQTGLSVNSSQQAFIRSFNAAGAVDSSTSTAVFSLANVPVSPGIVSVWVTSVAVSWGNNSNSPGTTFDVGVSGDGVTFASVLTTTGTSGLVSGLTSKTTYYFGVRAMNGNSIPTAYVVTAATRTLPVAISGAPSQPTDQGVYRASTTLTFTWTSGALVDPDSTFIGYRLHIGTTAGGNNSFSGDVGNVTSYVFYGGQDGLTYYARVCAMTGGGACSAWSSNSDGIGVDLSTPPAPTLTSTSHPNQSLTYAERTASIQIASPSDFSGISGFYFQIDTSPTTVPIPQSSTLTTSVSITSASLSDATHYFHIVAVDGAGNVGASVGHFKIQILTAINPAAGAVYQYGDGASVTIPAGAVSGPTSISVTVPSAGAVPALPSGSVVGTDAYREITLDDPAVRVTGNLTITVPYTVGQIGGVAEGDLKMAYFNTTSRSWVLVPNSTVNTGANTVTATVDHLTLFRLVSFGTQSTELTELSNYPNPFVAGGGGATKIRYVLRSAGDVRIRIFDLLGDLVWESRIGAGQTPGGVAGPNDVPWDGKNGVGQYVAAGGYICVVQGNGAMVKTKIGVK